MDEIKWKDFTLATPTSARVSHAFAVLVHQLSYLRALCAIEEADFAICSATSEKRAIGIVADGVDEACVLVNKLNKDIIYYTREKKANIITVLNLNGGPSKVATV